MFAQGKPLGPRGLFWMKVHLANMVGQKGTLAERVAFIERSMPLILDTADHPLDGKCTSAIGAVVIDDNVW